MNKKIFLSLALVFLLISAEAAAAGYRNWDLKLGAGFGVTPVYSGSAKLTYRYFPLVIATYESRYGALHFEENRGWITFIKNAFVSISTGAEFGTNRRKSSLPEFGGDNDQDILEGTPTLENPVRYFGEVVYNIPMGKLTTAAHYIPVKAKYAQVAGEVRPDRDYDGFLVSVSWDDTKWLYKGLNINYFVGIDWMNENYADAYYGIQYATNNLPGYDVASGFEKVTAKLLFTYMFNRQVGARIAGIGSYLLGGAKDSPLAESSNQASIRANVFYVF